ncbi:hypothetical protein MVES1_000511 [Malassezia vespertilionis]|uniref:uncharacterized protein n=1 Tax=Malassezia vespertilionis TaxID=2020962 RepID=UPI0024B1C888|nr:uncharacterized protein MVES1_000511 [Malassezia vespertilionis]WFD05185.1 hypothetical protein MVES1_000511 [Malassezia vespertilionis]
MSQRLVVVSNRLPVTINPNSSVPGGYVFNESTGGLVSALCGTKKAMEFTWIGWPGPGVPTGSIPYIETTLREEYNCKPVWLPDEMAERHYNGFSNSILWPLFHYHPGEMSFDEENWTAYREANMRFAKAVMEVLRPGDRVWVQDYHLMLLPLMLTALLEGSGIEVLIPHDNPKLGLIAKICAESMPEFSVIPARSCAGDRILRRSDIKIGFFLHTPFPSSEVYRILPVRREILLGVLFCDLIGFQTYDYVRHFLSSCMRILGLPTFPNGAAFGNRHVQVRTYPIGIEPQQFEECLQQESVQSRISQLSRRFEGVKIIIGVDRLDYIKGIPQKLQGLETFFEDHPEWIGRVVLLQIAVPSRQDVEEYQNLHTTVNETVGRINGRFGTVESLPIHLLYRSVPFKELCALYAASDVCLVTSTRDGMNLVSYESLNGSLIINPWDRFAVADAIYTALTMQPEARRANSEKMLKYVKRHTASWWGRSFVEDLGKTHDSRLDCGIEHA